MTNSSDKQILVPFSAIPRSFAAVEHTLANQIQQLELKEKRCQELLDLYERSMKLEENPYRKEQLRVYIDEIGTLLIGYRIRKEALVQQSDAAQQEDTSIAQMADGTMIRSTEEASRVDEPQAPLVYIKEEQPWYSAEFPDTKEIDQKLAAKLKSEIDVVIMTADDTELEAVVNLLRPYPRRRKVLRVYIGPETYYLGKFGAYKSVISKCRMGATDQGAATLAADQAQRVWQPRAVIMVGIAFGKDPRIQRLGDVLIASQVIPYEQQQVGKKLIYHSPIPPSDASLLNRFENAHNWQFRRPDGTLCRVISGPILSGEKFIVAPHFKAQLFQQFPQAIGWEMEGAGLVAATGRLGTPWILVKAVYDWGEGKKHDKHKSLAAAAAASLVHHILLQRTALHTIEKPKRV